MHQVSATMRSITLSWPQPEQPNGIILDYEIRYYEKVSQLCPQACKTRAQLLFSGRWPAEGTSGQAGRSPEVGKNRPMEARDSLGEFVRSSLAKLSKVWTPSGPTRERIFQTTTCCLNSSVRWYGQNQCHFPSCVFAILTQMPRKCRVSPKLPKTLWFCRPVFSKMFDHVLPI